MFQWINNLFLSLAKLCCDLASGAAASDAMNFNAYSSEQTDWIRPTSTEWITSEPSSGWETISEPACNIDGTPMCGSLDIHGNRFGVTGSPSDSWSSKSCDLDSFSSSSWGSDLFSSMGFSSDW